MFRRAKQLFRRFQTRVLVLVLVPAVFFGTLPHVACICADGHREEHCQALACRNSRAQPLEADKCGCCRDKSAKRQSKNCCQVTQSQRESSAKLVVATGSCCNPILEAPAPIVTAGKSDLAAKSLLIATIEPANWFQSAEKFHSAHSNYNFSTPPPIDVIVVYLHLTI